MSICTASHDAFCMDDPDNEDAWVRVDFSLKHSRPFIFDSGYGPGICIADAKEFHKWFGEKLAAIAKAEGHGQ